MGRSRRLGATTTPLAASSGSGLGSGLGFVVGFLGFVAPGVPTRTSGRTRRRRVVELGRPTHASGGGEGTGVRPVTCPPALNVQTHVQPGRAKKQTLSLSVNHFATRETGPRRLGRPAVVHAVVGQLLQPLTPPSPTRRASPLFEPPRWTFSPAPRSAPRPPWRRRDIKPSPRVSPRRPPNRPPSGFGPPSF